MRSACPWRSGSPSAVGTLERLSTGGEGSVTENKGWPGAAWGHRGQRCCSTASEWPTAVPSPHLAAFLRHGLTPLSKKATSGFHSRLTKSRFATRKLSHEILRITSKMRKATDRQDPVSPVTTKRMSNTAGRDNRRSGPPIGVARAWSALSTPPCPARGQQEDGRRRLTRFAHGGVLRWLFLARLPRAPHVAEEQRRLVAAED